MESTEKIEKEDFGLDVEEMARAGLHFGHKTSKTHPKMLPFIFGMRNTIHVIDLEKTKEKFIEALKFLKKATLEGKVILFVGTKPQIRDLVKKTAIETENSYVVYRWIGGTFTNFPEIKKRVDYLKELEKKKESGELEKYTKKERMEIEEEIDKLERKFGGIKNLENLPDIIFVCDMVKNKLAVDEAKRKGIKIVAISDTNADPSLADYPIPANDDAVSSVKYILEKVKDVILKAKQKQ
jgi:small subunit ribosomal protein S2